ncbi:MAG: leucyl aminopeptidase [Deltaproteobacteria bacterium]|nr:leucyl aminopeptidase [Deltaproteobacteria bacterium]
MDIKITVAATVPLQAPAEVLVLGVPSGAAFKKALAPLTKALGASLARALKRSEFSGKKGQLCDVPIHSASVKASRVALVGLGEADAVDAPELRRLAARGARFARSLNAQSLAIGAVGVSVDGGEAVLAQGSVLGAYRFEHYKTGERLSKFPLEKVVVLTTRKVDGALRQSVSDGQRVAEAICLARDLINTAPNDLYPESLAEYAQKVCADRKDGGLSCTVLKHAQLKQRGMSLIDAVGRGSAKPPVLIHMRYRPAGSKNEVLPKLAFVGKGLTFDTGGICIKPAPGMEEMKGDMGGAANVVALMAALAVTQPKAEIHGIIASAENMPDGEAYRPGDIFKSYQGKTVEIINTDAEGRLVLADALHYAVEQGVELILDNATLTGACIVALGPTVSGFFSNRPDLADRVKTASGLAGEAMWHLPLVEDLREMLKSDWADLKHVGDRWGGSITAALFLREFVGETPWIHVDIAGPSMANKAYDVYAKGGTGHGVLTYLALIDDLIKNRPAQAAG